MTSHPNASLPPHRAATRPPPYPPNPSPSLNPLHPPCRNPRPCPLSEADPRWPSPETVFEYVVDPRNRCWATWDSRLPASFRPPPDAPLHTVMVPTVDTLRVRHLAGALLRGGAHTLIVGAVGVGKTLTAGSLLEGLGGDSMSHCVINFSAQTTSNSLQVRVGRRRAWLGASAVSHGGSSIESLAPDQQHCRPLQAPLADALAACSEQHTIGGANALLAFKLQPTLGVQPFSPVQEA